MSSSHEIKALARSINDKPECRVGQTIRSVFVSGDGRLMVGYWTLMVEERDPFVQIYIDIKQKNSRPLYEADRITNWINMDDL